MVLKLEAFTPRRRLITKIMGRYTKYKILHLFCTAPDFITQRSGKLSHSASLVRFICIVNPVLIAFPIAKPSCNGLCLRNVGGVKHLFIIQISPEVEILVFEFTYCLGTPHSNKYVASAFTFMFSVTQLVFPVNQSYLGIWPFLIRILSNRYLRKKPCFF